MMEVVFVSNYINHHQLPFCRAMIASKEVEFTFLQMEQMDEERIGMGWDTDPSDYPFVRLYKDDPGEGQRLIDESEVVIYGGVEEESYLEKRLTGGKLTVRYSERIYKEGQWKFISPRGLKKKYHDHIRYRNAPVYLLCSGAYVASDFHLIHAYPDKMYCWGYFPEFVPYDYDVLTRQKHERDTDIVEILWAGRMIDWKHPELAIRLAEDLAKKKTAFHMTMIGGGEQNARIRSMASEKGLDSLISFPGFLPPKEVRERMLASDIFLFTSDFKEGWGAVLNEAMNAGCAVVASSAIGAVPFLLEHDKNGMVYKNGNTEEFLRYAGELCKDPGKRYILGNAAYTTIANRWNAEYAAAALIGFLKSAIIGMPEARPIGPLSKAPIIAPKKGYEYTRQSIY